MIYWLVRARRDVLDPVVVGGNAAVVRNVGVGDRFGQVRGHLLHLERVEPLDESRHALGGHLGGVAEYRSAWGKSGPEVLALTIKQASGQT